MSGNGKCVHKCVSRDEHPGIQSRPTYPYSDETVACPKESSELVLPLMCCFCETQAVRMWAGGDLTTLKRISLGVV